MILIFSLFLISTSVSGTSLTEISIKRNSLSFESSTRLALFHSIHAQKSLYSLGSMCRSDKEKAAWSDCVDLYESTIHYLKKTLNSSRSQDSRTWLSTAMTNLETCKVGFIEFGITDNVYGMISNDVSELLSRLLAMNKRYHDEETSKNKGFPSWVSKGDRKLLRSSNPPPDIVVAMDGSGDYTTVSAAVAAAGERSRSGRFVIYVKKGIYNEYVQIGRNLVNIFMFGDGMEQTIITGSRSNHGGSTTRGSATFSVSGEGFIAKWITFRNTAGRENGQAVAVLSDSDRSIFYQSSFEGYQDTLYVHTNRQYYRRCNIYGTVDFIFGNAAVIFQKCNLFVRYFPTQINTITAQSRNDPNQNTGIVVQSCTVRPVKDLTPIETAVNDITYLGRPWRPYAKTVFMETYLGRLINLAGWLSWGNNLALSTLYYAEYRNFGPGSSTSKRVTWAGYHVVTTPSVALQFTPDYFIGAGSWLPETGVPYQPGL